LFYSGNLSNNMPASTTDFTSLRMFSESFKSDYLLQFSEVNFM